MKLIKLLNISVSCALLPISLYAQTPTDTVRSKNIGNEDILIVKSYQPVLNDAFKINITPSGDTSSVKSPVLKYEVDPRPMNSNYNLSPIKPVRIKDDNIKKLYRGFVKAGYGLENMPMLDLYFNTLRSKSIDAGISFKHLSSTGKIKDYGSPGNSSNELGLHGTKFFPKFSMGAKLGFERNLVHFYGFKTPPDLYSKAETKHRMNDINGRFDISSLNTSKSDWKYNGALDFYSFKDNRSSSENNVGFSFGGGKKIDLGYVSGDGALEFMTVDQDSINYNRSIIRLRPKITITKDLYTIEAGVNIAFEGNDGHSDDHMYPHINASYQVIDDQFSIFAAMNGDIIRNDLRSLSKENPFTGKMLAIGNTNDKLTLSGGFKAKLDHDLMFTAEAAFSRLKDQPFFYNTFDTLFPVTFSTVYDDVNLLKIKASLEYKMGEKATFAINADFNKYNTDALEHALYSPVFKLGINGQYVIADKIYLKADMFYNGESYAIEYPDNKNVAKYTTLKSYFDANLGVDYRYTKLLSVFVQLNNVGFAQYFKWYRYPGYRFTGMVGATYSF